MNRFVLASAAMTKEDRLISVNEAAWLLSVHTRTIRNWAMDGLLEERRLGPHLVRVTLRSVRSLAQMDDEPLDDEP